MRQALGYQHHGAQPADERVGVVASSWHVPDDPSRIHNLLDRVTPRA